MILVLKPRGRAYYYHVSVKGTYFNKLKSGGRKNEKNENKVINDMMDGLANCDRITSPEVIISRIRAVIERNERYTHVYVEVSNHTKDYTFQIYPDVESFEYYPRSNTIEFTSDGGMMLSTLFLGNAEMYHRIETFDGTDQVNEYYHIAYPDGEVITIEVLRVAV